MIKYAILVVVVGLCGYIGFGFSSYYTNRAKFFKSLELLFDKLKTEIRFSQHKLIEILCAFPSHSVHTKKLIKNFVDCLNLDKEISNQNLFADIKILSEDEKNLLLIFFQTLGKFDALNQTNQIATQQNELANFAKRSEDDAKKYAPLYIKLGIIVGLVVALIFA